jgi:hypothetical protein
MRTIIYSTQHASIDAKKFARSYSQTASPPAVSSADGERRGRTVVFPKRSHTVSAAWIKR